MPEYSNVVTVKMSDEQKRKMRVLAAMQDKTMSEFMRQCLDEQVGDVEPMPAF